MTYFPSGNVKACYGKLRLVIDFNGLPTEIGDLLPENIRNIICSSVVISLATFATIPGQHQLLVNHPFSFLAGLGR